jgi:hypothetical protein
MPFDKEAEGNEPLKQIELFFETGKPLSKDDIPMPPMAYIGMGSFFTAAEGHPLLTNRAASYEELKANVEILKASLDALLVEAKVRFATVISN